MRYLLLAAAGLAAASFSLWVEPLLIAHRLEPYQRGPNNPVQALTPVYGIFRLVPQPYEREDRNMVFRIQAVVFELAVVAVFVSLGIRFADVKVVVLGCLFTAILGEITLTDIHYRRVLNWISYPAVALSVAASALWPGIGPGSSLLGAAAGLAVFLAIEVVGRGAMGRGDTKLAMLIGAMRGYPGVVGALLAGIFVGGAIALALLLSGRGRRSYFAYGPALAIGAVLSFFFGSG